MEKRELCFWKRQIEGVDGSVKEEITKINKTEDEDTGYWYNSSEWRDKSCVFGIFDVLPDEAESSPEGVRSGPKAASNREK